MGDEPTGQSTGSLAGARGHARAQADATARVLPAGVLWDETIETGGYASRVVPRGSVVRFTDDDGDACLQLVVYNAATPSERLNVADTVKVQWQAYLGEGALLLSDMGRVLMTLVDDSSARHDCLCGATTRASADAKYGDGRLSGPTPNARDLLCVAAAKHGLQRVDVGPNVNLFKSVRVESDGALVLDGEPAPATYVELRAELDVLLLVANTPHPLDPRPSYAGNAVRATARRGEIAADDPWRSTSQERQRAFENTDEVLLGLAR